MTDEQILEVLRSALAEVLGAERPIGAHTHIVRELELDSLQRIGLIVEVENRFRICLVPEDEERIRTIGDLAEVIRRHLEADGRA